MRASCVLLLHSECRTADTQTQGTYSAACVSMPLRFNRGAGALHERKKSHSNNKILKRRAQQFTLRCRFNSGNLLNDKVHMHYSEISRVHTSPLQTRCPESLSALTTLSNCRRSGSPDYPSLPVFLATGRPLTWRARIASIPGRGSADEQGCRG